MPDNMCRRREKHQPNLDHLTCGSVSGARVRRLPHQSMHMELQQESTPADRTIGGGETHIIACMLACRRASHSCML